MKIGGEAENDALCHSWAHHTRIQHTRTHLPIEKAPKIITLIWFSGSNLILSLSFTSHFYFLSIFAPSTSSSTVARRCACRFFSIHFHSLSVLSVPAYCVVACCWQVRDRACVGVRGAHTKILSLKQHQLLKMVRYSHAYNQKKNKIHSSVDDGNRA